MSKYRFKTKEEFVKDGLCSSFNDVPTHWASNRSMNEYLGQDVPDEFIDNIENGESFHIKSWTFRANNCILKEPVNKFIVGDTIRVISTHASEEDWRKIGKIDVNFNVGDIFTVEKTTNYSLQIVQYESWYPLSMFEKYDKPTKEYTVEHFVVGQSVRVIATETSLTHWKAVGKIKFPYSKGDILVIERVAEGLSFTGASQWAYPACMFEPIPIKNHILRDSISAPESLVGKYIKVVKDTGRKDLPIDFVGKISKEETSYIYIEGLTTCISKDRIRQGELIISDYLFGIEIPSAEYYFRSSLVSSKKTIPNPREIILIKPISIKKRLKL